MIPRGDVDTARNGGPRAFIDMHVHTSASFDSLASPAKVMRAALERGLTHLVITDHDRIDGALRMRDAAPAGLTIIVGSEIRTSDGDLIGAFLTRPVTPRLSARETISAIREQGGLVGIPHPFDRFRGSLLRDTRMDGIGPLVDWIEAHNARLLGGGTVRAAAFAVAHDRPGLAASDAHTVLEIGVAYTVLVGDPSTPAGLLAALPSAKLVTGRASMAVRLWTPLAKALQRVRGNGRTSSSVEA